MKRKTPCEVYREKMARISDAHKRGESQETTVQVERLVGNPWCPLCGAQLELRINRDSGKPVLGCSRFPSCRGNRPYRR